MAKLILSLDDVVLEEIPLAKERTTIGRKPHNDIQIDNLAVSGEHAVIVTILNDCFLEDLGSTNGTLVNGVLARKHLLQNNDVIELGKYKLKFVGMASSPAPTPADYEKTMIWRPGGVKPPAAPGGVPSAPPAPPAAPPQPPLAATRPAPPPPPAAAPAAKSPAAPRTRPAPLTPLPSSQAGAPHLHGVIRFLSGDRAGREMKLEKPLTTLGKPGTQVAVVTRRHEGFFIAHVEGATPTHVNGRPIGATPQALKDRDTFELADVRMEFLLQQSPAEESPNRFWKLGLVVLGFVILGIIYYRMRG
jgi:pSer/pThr/pTyr-binding forkhead associated (FHA) protein